MSVNVISDPTTGTAEESEYTYQLAVTGYAEDFIRQGIINAADESAAEAFARHFQNGGGTREHCWYDYKNDGVHAWFGTSSGDIAAGTFQRGERHVHLSWRAVVRRARQEAVTEGVLF